MELCWILEKSDEKQVDDLKKSLNIHPTICRLLVQRGVTTYNEAKSFFRPSLDDLHDPFLMKGMDVAIERIRRAIDQKEKILIYGDYDVDGTTAVALFYTFFKKYTSDIDYYIPDRYKEGYGLSMQGIEWAKENGYQVIVSLDCGITAVDEIAYAQSIGIDVIVGDHHLPGDQIPPALATLDPKTPECEYPYKELSGCGIGFKICQAYAQAFDIDDHEIYDLLDFVVISIASDIVPITGENRILAYYGLQKINGDPRPGIKVIFDSLNIDREVNVSDLVFIVGPRINAAGRMEHANLAVDLMIDENTLRIDDKINALNINNDKRRDIDKTITQEALDLVAADETHKDKFTTVLYQSHWHKGVVGIVASRLIENYYKPTLILTDSGDGLISGSARSVKGFSIYDALDASSEYLESFGGHKYAAGVALKKENLEAFKAKLDEVVKNTIAEECLHPQIRIDAEIDLAAITPKFYSILQQFAPFGPGNMRPVFMAKELKDAGRSRVLKDKHVKLNVKNGGMQYMDGIGFGMAEKFPIIRKGNFNVCFNIEENHWNNKTTLQLKLKDLKSAESMINAHETSS